MRARIVLVPEAPVTDLDAGRSLKNQGLAELKMLNEGDLDAVNNFKAVMSSNLRTLLN